MSGSIHPAGRLVQARAEHGAARLVDGRVLLYGGTAFRPVDRAEIFDPATGHWSETGRLSEPRSGQPPALLPDGRVVVLGGAEAGGGEIFDPNARAWVKVPYGRTRARHEAVNLPDGRIALVGGTGKGLLDRIADVLPIDLLDPRTGVFAVAGALPEGRTEHTATALGDGRILVVGGRRAVENGAAPALLWSADGSIVPLPGAEPRHGHTATLLADGRVLIAGGVGAKAMRLESAELFDPQTGTFTAAGRMVHARASHAATRLPDGSVLMTGGESYLVVKECERFDSAKGEWSVEGSLATGRFGHSATLLADGRVLVAGGIGRPGRDHTGETVLDLAEVWHPEAAPSAIVAADQLPPCPGCAAKLFAPRVARERYLSSSGAFVGGHWEYVVSCAKCLAGIRLEWSENGSRMVPPVIEAEGSVLARLRETLAQAASDGRLQAELLRQMGTPDRGWMLGVPEVLATARPGLPNQVRLSANARLLPPDSHRVERPVMFRNQPASWTLEKLSAFLSRAEMAPALKGDLPAGGFLAPADGSRFRETVILAGTPLSVTGIRSGHFLLSVPAFAQERLGGVGSVMAPLGLVRAALDAQP